MKLKFVWNSYQNKYWLIATNKVNKVMTDNGYNTVVVQDHAIAITEADCPDHICVQSGFITQPGATTVCLPHKVMIEVRSADSQEPDVIPAR